MATPNARLLARPAKDEWGVYDPQQAGLAALFARLDAKDNIAPAPAPAVKKEIPDYPAPARQGFAKNSAVVAASFLNVPASG